MDYEPVRAGLAQAIPYNNHLKLELAGLGDGSGSVRLPDDDELRNHVGSQHAGGLFSAGEFASGAAFVGAFAERLGDVTPLARSASIEYLKLARGPITATGRLGEDKRRCSTGSIRTGVWSSPSRSSSATRMTTPWPACRSPGTCGATRSR